jgi:hypothetical protein
MKQPITPLQINDRLLSAQGKAMKVMLAALAFIAIFIAIAVHFTSGTVDAAEAQLTDIKAGDMKAAYDITATSFQQQTPMDEFVKFVNKYAILKNYKSVTFSEHRDENGVSYLSGTIEGTDGSKMKIDYELVMENDRWKVLAFRLSKLEINGAMSVKPIPDVKKSSL